MRHLITSALPYINGTKHLGNLVGSMLPADVYARFLRQQGNEVLFICATDDHGTPAELGALKDGEDVAAYCQKHHEKQRAIYEQFGLSFDYFGQSSSQDNHELTQHIYHELDKNGFIEEREIVQIYSIDDKRFLPDRYITGTCPRCGYEAARGDQCENCTSVLNPTDLLNPRSTVSGSTNLEQRKTRHLFLKLSTLAPEIRKWVESHPEWPKLTYSIALKWLDEGLKDRCITRDLEWGVPVPRPGFEDKVFYVWFDAPIAYIATTKAWASHREDKNEWKKWWFDQEDVQYTQFMGKDNVPFHAVFFPAVLLGTREPWKLVDYLKSLNWLNYYGGKFSTSQQRGVFTDQALDILPADYWRYVLIANAPESSDAAFTWELLQSKVNDELADKFGNFVNRTIKLATSHYGNKVPAGGEPGEAEQRLQKQCNALADTIAEHFEKREFRKATEAIRDLWDVGNAYFNEQAPWKLIKENPEQAALVIRTCINLIRLYAVATAPITPFASDKILDSLHTTSAPLKDATNLIALKAGHAFDDIPVLFKKIENDQVVEYKKVYGAEGAE